VTISSTAGTTTPRDRSGHFRIGVLVLVVLTAAWRWWTTSRWSWFADDWVYLDQTQSMGFLEYVFQGYNSHLMPGQFLLTWVITEADPLDYRWAALLLTFFAVASLVAWAAAFREMFGERVRVLFPLALLALSPLLLMPTVWWASGIQVLPLQLSMGLSVLFLARYLLRGRRRRDMAWLVLSYAMGLFFWEKALLIAIPLVVVGWVLTPGSARERLTSLARTSALLVVVSVAYAVVFFSTRRAGALAVPRTEFSPRSLGDWTGFLNDSAQNVGLPALAGGPFERLTDAWDIYQPVSTTLSVTLTVVFLALTAVALVVRRTSVPAVAGVLSYAAVSWGLVLTSDRYEDTILTAAGTGRYAVDILPVAALGIALLTTRTVLEPAGTALRRPLPRRVEGAGRLVLAGGALAVVAAMVVTNAATWDAARGSSPRSWVDAMVADSRRVGEATLVDVSSPPRVIHPVLFQEYAALSRLLGPLDLPLAYDEPSSRLLVPDEDGHLWEADVVDVAATNLPSADPACGFLVQAGRTTTVPMSIDLYPFGWGVRLDYFAELATQVQVRTDTDVVDLDLAAGLQSVQLKVTGAVTSFEISAPDTGTPVCVTQVLIGGFGPSDRPPWP
jgi:hypothetical protein